VKKTPDFVFGHGLSYTSFSYANLKTSVGGQSLTAPADGQVMVSVEVTNTGPMDGDEVVQLYVSKPTSTVARPSIRVVRVWSSTVQWLICVKEEEWQKFCAFFTTIPNL
jgi:hypothetical protein